MKSADHWSVPQSLNCREALKLMSDPLLTIRNNHAASCGDPPIVSAGDSSTYIGYFQNRFGEQWIFTYDRKTDVALLRGGDIGWNTAHAVINGTAGDLILNADGRTMAKRSCWTSNPQVQGPGISGLQDRSRHKTWTGYVQGAKWRKFRGDLGK